MSRATITSKGQVTIPKDVRDQLKLGTGDVVDFVVENDGCARLVPAKVKLADLEGMLPAPRKAVTLADMKRAIRMRAARL